MIGEGYWSTGIMVRYYADGEQWSISLEFKDNGFCDKASTEGRLSLRYAVTDLSAGIDTLKADAERLGITWIAQVPSCPTVYMDGDGEDEDRDYPENWRKVINDQARRLGWATCYRELAAL
jgi:hypothetical protein